MQCSTWRRPDRIHGPARDGGQRRHRGPPGRVFRILKDIKEGDALVLDTPVALEQYRVESMRITIPDDVSVIDPTPDRAVTLVGCYPFYHRGAAPKRFIVRAVPASGSPAGTGLHKLTVITAKTPHIQPSSTEFRRADAEHGVANNRLRLAGGVGQDRGLGAGPQDETATPGLATCRPLRHSGQHLRRTLDDFRRLASRRPGPVSGSLSRTPSRAAHLTCHNSASCRPNGTVRWVSAKGQFYDSPSGVPSDSCISDGYHRSQGRRGSLRARRGAQGSPAPRLRRQMGVGSTERDGRVVRGGISHRRPRSGLPAVSYKEHSHLYPASVGAAARRGRTALRYRRTLRAHPGDGPRRWHAPMGYGTRRGPARFHRPRRGAPRHGPGHYGAQACRRSAGQREWPSH